MIQPNNDAHPAIHPVLLFLPPDLSRPYNCECRLRNIGYFSAECGQKPPVYCEFGLGRQPLVPPFSPKSTDRNLS
jgi:hypothetical protein